MATDRSDLAGVPHRPVLRSGLRRLWRDDTRLQLGLTAPYATVLDGVTDADRRLLDRLDGRSTAARLVDAAADPDGAARLLRSLAAHGVLDEAGGVTAARTGARSGATETGDARLAPDLAALALRNDRSAGAVLDRRANAHVQIRGAGRVGALLAVLLTAAGVGRIEIVDPRPLRAGDLPAVLADPLDDDEDGELRPPPTRADAARAWATRIGVGSTRSTLALTGAPASGPPPPADVVVLTPAATCGAVDPRDRDDLLRDGIPHLVAGVRETTGFVGPFVLPGDGPCLRCVDLIRTDRDPAWPRLLAQLVAGPGPTATEPVDAGDGVLATLVAAHAALELLAHVDGATPATWGATHEVRADAPVAHVRAWAVHPACGCGWGAADATG
jgi:hypothetical protein